MARRLIITNGDSTVAVMQTAALDAEFLPWRDALHDGPVAGGLLLEALSLIRAQFLATEFRLPLSEVNRGFADRDAAVRGHGRYDRIELWFEHDLYDQLQLIQLLDFFSAEKRSDGLFLVQADDYLGAQQPEAMRTLEGAAEPVTGRHFEAAGCAWSAFTAATPEALAAQASTNTPVLPYLAVALQRLIQELPAIGSGLGLTQERVLLALTEQPRPVAELFRITQEQETARFLGDLSFFRRIDEMAFAETPLLAGPRSASNRGPTGGAADYHGFARTTLTVTDAGRAALAERFDHARDNGIDRWLGGTHLTSGSLWRRNRERAAIASMSRRATSRGSSACIRLPMTATPAAPALIISAAPPAAIPPIASTGSALARQTVRTPEGPSTGPYPGLLAVS